MTNWRLNAHVGQPFHFLPEFLFSKQMGADIVADNFD